ncbi:MAG: hypothetical protein NVSMB52_10190 [Chloroflexota bacterium]
MFDVLLAASTTSSGNPVPGLLGGLIGYAIAVIPMWVIFTKAGRPGWAALIPIYNYVVLLRVAGRPWWWIFLFLIPFVNFIMFILVMVSLSRSFGHGGGFAVGLIFLSIIFFYILAFSSNEYVGPNGNRSLSSGIVGTPLPA